MDHHSGGEGETPGGRSEARRVKAQAKEGGPDPSPSTGAFSGLLLGFDLSNSVVDRPPPLQDY